VAAAKQPSAPQANTSANRASPHTGLGGGSARPDQAGGQAVRPPAQAAGQGSALARPPAQVVHLHREAPDEGDGRLRASPLAKKMASEQGLDLAALHGSGPSGRIIKRDIEAAMSQGGAARQLQHAPALAPMERRAPDELPLTAMRKVIAQRMGEVKPGVPHFYLSVEVDMKAALGIREEAKALESKVSVNDIIVKASAIAVRRMPSMNRSYEGDRILQHFNVDVGIAVAIEDGLITPVVRDADQKTLSQISQETRELAERARKRALKPAEYAGGSITVSNLGMFGIDSFIAVINPPQAAILAVGAVTEKPVVKDGGVVVRPVMSITLSGDHRVIDGAVGARYLKELKALLEHPMRLLF
ncbi:MAG: dihydrolipoamide acetyltransferase family protein, partial [Myxococcaceae bacterium]